MLNRRTEIIQFDMPRKRKIKSKSDGKDSQLDGDRNEVKKYLYKSQTDEAYHKKYAKELRQLYERVSFVEHEMVVYV